MCRWYCKRSTSFPEGGPKPIDLVDAPPMAPPDLVHDEKLGIKGTTAGRHLNRAPDPVMNLEELVDMLEDFEVVPQLVSRADAKLAFNAALKVRFVRMWAVGGASMGVLHGLGEQRGWITQIPQAHNRLTDTLEGVCIPVSHIVISHCIR